MPLAAEDLEEIRAFIAENNPDAAEQLNDELLDRAFSIGSFPYLGWKPPELRRQDVREIAHRNYRIVYRVVPEQEEIHILRFWHAARGTPRF
jgi:plasmid stabilization system protein ParE